MAEEQGLTELLRAEGVRPHGSSLLLHCTSGYVSLLHLYKLWPKRHLSLQKTSGLYKKNQYLIIPCYI